MFPKKCYFWNYELLLYCLKKELSLWNKIKYLNLNIFRTQCCKPLIFQTQITWSNRIHSLKYLRSSTFGSNDIVIRKSEFVEKTQFLCGPNGIENDDYFYLQKITIIHGAWPFALHQSDCINLQWLIKRNLKDRKHNFQIQF